MKEKIKGIHSKLEYITIENITKISENPEKKIDKRCLSQWRKIKANRKCIFRDIKLIEASNIKKVYVKLENKIGYSPQTGALEKKKQEWVIETDGTNLKECFLQDGIDFTRIISNDIYEIYKTLGIEAVRKALIAEVRNVLRH